MGTVVMYATTTPQSTLTGDGAASSGQGTTQTSQRVTRPAPPPARDIKAEFRAYNSTNENRDYTAQRNRTLWEPHDDEGELPAGYSNPHVFADPRFAREEENAAKEKGREPKWHSTHPSHPT